MVSVALSLKKKFQFFGLKSLNHIGETLLKSVLFSRARKNMYVQLLVILAMDLVTQHVIVTWYATWKKWNVEYWKKIIICLNYLVNVVLEELFEPFFILVINKKKIIFNFWMWFMICCFCMKSVKMQFKCLISDALCYGLIEVMDRLWLSVIVALFALFFVKPGDKITWWKNGGVCSCSKESYLTSQNVTKPWSDVHRRVSSRSKNSENSKKDVYSLYIDDVNNRNVNNDSNAQLVVTNDIVYKYCLANVV